MQWPQIAIIVLFALEVGASIALDGQPKSETHNWFVNAIWFAIVSAVLYAGGFWK